jgi:hypothetical protein
MVNMTAVIGILSSPVFMPVGVIAQCSPSR